MNRTDDNGSGTSPALLLIAGWRIDTATHCMSRGADEQRLEPKVMQLLQTLAARPGEVFSRQELLECVWRGTVVGDDALTAAIIKIRKAFSDDARKPRVIQTVPKAGYRLIAEIGTPKPASDNAPGALAPVPEARGRRLTSTILCCLLDLDTGSDAPDDPELWQSQAEGFAAVANEAIAAQGGTVRRDSGALLGIFGAPLAVEHHAARAVHAAVELRNAYRTHRQRTRPEVMTALRIALASGAVVVHPADAADSVEVFGAPVQDAMALARATPSDAIAISATTRSMAEGLVGYRQWPSGSNEHGTGGACLVDDTVAWTSGWEARAARGLSPLVGRDLELEQLGRLLAHAARGDGQIVSLVGSPGAGKSRLIHELLRLAADRGCSIRAGHTSPVVRHTPFNALLPMFRDCLRIEGDVSPDPSLVDAFLARRGMDALTYRAPLLSLLDLDVDEPGWREMEPADRRVRLLDALEAVLADPDGTGTSVLVVEDLHWADEATVEFLDRLASRIGARPCLMVASYRPEYTDDWAAWSYYARLRVDALGRKQAEELLTRLVGSDDSLAGWKSEVIDRAEGTPLFVEESVRALETRGVFTGERGAYALKADVDTGEVPATVQAIIADRIDRLSAQARELLELACVIGRRAPLKLLDALWPDAHGARRALLLELQSAEMLCEAKLHGQPGCVFKHALTQEVAYLSLLKSTRAEYHCRIARTIENELPVLARAEPELLARHHAEADQFERALVYLTLAAHRDLQAAAFTDALTKLEDALTMLGSVPEGESHDALELDIRLAQGVALVQKVGPTDAAVEAVYERARKLCETTGEMEERYKALWGLWFVHMMRGSMHRERELGAELFVLAVAGTNTAPVSAALVLEAHHVQWSGLCLVGDSMAVREHTEEGIARYEPDKHHWLTFVYGGHDPGVCARNVGAMALWLLGFPDQARKRSDAAISLACELGHPYTQLESYNSALNFALLDHDADTLEARAGDLKQMAQDGKLPDVASGFADGFLGAARILRGDTAQGVHMMSEAAHIWQEFWGAWCFPLDSMLAHALGSLGRIDAGLTLVDERLQMAEQDGAHWWDAEFFRTRAELNRLAPGLPAADRIESDLNRALECARTGNSRYFELRVGMSLARWRDAQGDVAQARNQVEETYSAYTEGFDSTELIAARTWLDAH